jgi:hypothetical protein
MVTRFQLPGSMAVRLAASKRRLEEPGRPDLSQSKTARFYAKMRCWLGPMREESSDVYQPVFWEQLYRSMPVIRELRAVSHKLRRVTYELRALNQTLLRTTAMLLQAQLVQDPRYADPKRLLRYCAQTFSQNGEDGIIAEILRRIGTTSRQFLEIGVGNGMENNTALLLAQGWSGWWVEGDERAIAEIKLNFREQLAKGQLTLIERMTTAENVVELLAKAGVPAEFDVLSIDIDRNTYWVWAALRGFHPRVAVIEYNSFFPPNVDWKIEYSPELTWNGTAYFGASLKALELVRRELGYSLVGCEPMGVNAFFVRSDLCGDYFAAPFAAENHYEPPRYGRVVRVSEPFHDERPSGREWL